MVAKAHAKYLRISPRKVKIVADLIRGKSLEQATAILLTTPKAASEPLLKLLKSAAANAENNHKMDPENLYVSEVFATPGPIIKRISLVQQCHVPLVDIKVGHGRGFYVLQRAFPDKLGQHLAPLPQPGD